MAYFIADHAYYPTYMTSYICFGQVNLYKPNYIAIKAHITPTWNELIRNIINKCMI